MGLPKPKKGERVPGSGRKPGTPNKITRVMREDWLEAYEKRGGIEYLLRLDDETFAKGLLRMIPNEVAAKLEAEVRLRVIDHSDRKKGAGDGSETA